ISRRTETLQTVFEEYALALDTTLANRANALDTQLVERTKALDSAFDERLRLFDESVLRSTAAIDSAVGENARSLTSAMEQHATMLSESINRQAVELDATLMDGIGAVRKTSENISRQSIRAIEGLASQADMLKSVSENLLGQINSVTNRFENQGQAILKSANALEGANFRIDKALGQRTDDLNRTLDRLSEKADEIGEAAAGYSQQIEGSVTDAEQRTRLLTQEMSREAEARSRDTIDHLSRLKSEALQEKDRALDDLKREFETVTREVTDRLGVLTTQFSQTSGEVRARARQAAETIQADQDRLRTEIERLPNLSRESSDVMRRAMQDQLKALDQLSQFARSNGSTRDVRAPRDTSSVVTTQRPVERPSPTPSQVAAASPLVPTNTGSQIGGSQASVSTPSSTDDRSRALNSLTTSLTRELSQRQAPRANGADVPTQATTAASATNGPQQHPNTTMAGNEQARSQGAISVVSQTPATATPAQGLPSGRASASWSVGDLLARASLDEPDPSDAGSTALDVQAISKAMDRTLAAAIWSRFRTGQRGFMVPSIYPQVTRELFHETEKRYRGETAFRANVDQFLTEFGQLLRQADEADPSGRTAHEQIISETGRVYLFLGHASGRIS
ncbi:MAG: hypothetical protein AAFR70_14305, partial [Pseudomonadota bacterium]